MRRTFAPLLCGLWMVCTSVVFAEQHKALAPSGMGTPLNAAPSGMSTAEMANRVAQFNANFKATHDGHGPEEFGIQCCQIMQIPVSAFTPFAAGEVWDAEPFLLGYMYPQTFGSQAYDLWAPVILPTGTGIAFLDLLAYDTDSIHTIRAELWAYPTADGSGTPHMLASAETGATFNGGFVYVPSTEFAYTVNNNVALGPGENLNVAIYADVPGGAVGFKSVDLWWFRQITPAPATATFNDVQPGAFGFQHIEALAASGITGGCGGGNYCPNGTLTRAQMAIFLAKALGLYWPF